jgi:hypothetical protein
MPNQVIKPATAVMLANQPNTFPEPDLTPINARNAKAVEQISATQGRPLRVVRLKKAGAFRATARPSAGFGQGARGLIR